MGVKVIRGSYSTYSLVNKPERVFGLQVRCRELDIFKIIEFFEFWGDFFGGIFWKDFFGRILWEDFFGRIFLGGFFGRIFWEDYWEDFLGGILCLHWN